LSSNFRALLHSLLIIGFEEHLAFVIANILFRYLAKFSVFINNEPIEGLLNISLPWHIQALGEIGMSN